jgi:DNA-directed RNA polymerase subunit RPC12/RpoP
MESSCEPMSEFKFACPVCGQHITADSTTSGGQLECPTCFQKIVVPQAPSSADPKFILSASQVGKPRPAPSGTDTQTIPSASRNTVIPFFVAAALLCVAGAAIYVFRGEIFKSAASQPPSSTNQTAQAHPVVPMTVYEVPTNVNWTLDLANADIPEDNAAGKIHRHGFRYEKATLQGGSLSLRQGPGGPPDLGVSIIFFAQQGEELSGKSIDISPERTPPLPRVVLRWKDEQEKAVNKNITSGYALKVVFGEAAAGRMPGKIYICLPDEDQSFVAGKFNAEIRKPNPPKPKQPKAPKPTG